jgi:hypothetical protein
VGMDGYGPMQAQLELRKTNPTLTHEEFVDNSEVPEDIWKQQSRLAYQGIPSQYKRGVISKSRFAKMLFGPGILSLRARHPSRVRLHGGSRAKVHVVATESYSYAAKLRRPTQTMSGAMTAETTSPVEAGTVYDQQTPIQLIAGRVSDALRLKLQRCVEFLPEVLMDIGLMNWEEFSHFGYESQPVERSSLLIYEDIAAGVADMKKPESQCKLSHSQADMLAKATRAVARGYNGMPEEPKSPGTSQGKGHIGSPYSKSDSQLSHDTARLTAFSHLRCTSFRAK